MCLGFFERGGRRESISELSLELVEELKQDLGDNELLMIDAEAGMSKWQVCSLQDSSVFVSQEADSIIVATNERGLSVKHVSELIARLKVIALVQSRHFLTDGESVEYSVLF